MSMTLNLVDRLLARGRNLQALGRTHDALRVFKRLAGFRELPADAAEETQARLAELHLHHHRFARARRHLTAALRSCPDSAHYHHLMATAAAADGRGDLERAAEHYRRSCDLEPDQPECLCEYGALALHLGRRDEGLASLRRAAELAPDDPDTLKPVAEGLCLANDADGARGLLRAALFRNPRDRRFRRLWEDFQFRQLRLEQERARLGSRKMEEEGPAVLPFVRPEAAAPGRRAVRHDGPSPVPPPHAGEPVRFPEQRHAL
jgi:Tfp pilus assembly protein PilF